MKIAVILLTVISAVYAQYIVDDSNGLGPTFDGIGGLSGGGATSRLLPSYSVEVVDKILDLLFKPNFAASLHILKVEIGGDGQSTDGTESSHMHSENEENYKTGYEWWLMTEAKKRNPNIKLYGLPWAYPAWVGKGSGSPYKYPDVTAGYIIKWITGAKQVYNLSIDYVGIWNERNFDSTYIKTLRKALDNASLQHVQIVAADGSFSGISNDVLKDSELSKAVSILGAHYPGTNSDENARKTGKKLWSSEDYSTYNDDTGAGCWARILNQNYVNGNMTSTISWNLIASYYNGLPYYRDGLMTAIEPWSGHFDINGPIYISAHTTQFTQPGDNYLPVDSGSGHLMKGGSFVSLVDSETKDLTIVIETISHDHSKCIRPSLLPYTVSPQNAHFNLKGSFLNINELYRWDSQLFNTGGTDPQYFIRNGTVKVNDGEFTIDLPVDHVMTLSTKKGQIKGTYESSPSKSFPVPYQDDFEGYEEYSEANYFADQYGVYEIRQSKHPGLGKVMMQVVPQHVISWCGDSDHTITLIGSNTWEAVSVSVQVVLPDVHDVISNVGAFVAARISSGGCSTRGASGVFFWINTAGFWNITADLGGSKHLTNGAMKILSNTIYTLTIDIEDDKITAAVDGKSVASDVSIGSGKGFVAMGTTGYFPAEFNNFKLAKAS